MGREAERRQNVNTSQCALNARNRAEALPDIISNPNDISERKLREVRHCGLDHTAEERQSPYRADSRAHLLSTLLSHHAPPKGPFKVGHGCEGQAGSKAEEKAVARSGPPSLEQVDRHRHPKATPTRQWPMARVKM